MGEEVGRLFWTKGGTVFGVALDYETGVEGRVGRHFERPPGSPIGAGGPGRPGLNGRLSIWGRAKGRHFGRPQGRRKWQPRCGRSTPGGPW